MGSLKKIIGPLVLLLAIAAAVLSFLLFAQRLKFRNRAADLAQGITETVKKLDAGSGSGKTSAVTFTPASSSNPKESGSLGWEAYKEAQNAQSNAYKKTIDEAIGLAEQIIKQRDALSINLTETANILGYPAQILPSSDDVKNLQKYAEYAEALLAHAEAVAKRDQEIITALNEIASQVQSSVSSDILVRKTKNDADGNAVAVDYEVKEAFKEFDSSVKSLKDRNDIFIKAVAGMRTQLSKYNAWTVNPANLRRADSRILTAEMKKFSDDLKGINNELIQKDYLQTEYDKQKEIISELEDNNKELASQKSDLEEDLRKIKRQLNLFAGFVGETDEAEEVKSFDDLAFDRNGSITTVDKDYGFAVVDLTDKDVMEGVNLAVSRAGKYIATLKVIKVTPEQAIADIKSGNINQVSKGDDVMVSAIHVKGIAGDTGQDRAKPAVDFQDSGNPSITE